MTTQVAYIFCEVDLIKVKNSVVSQYMHQVDEGYFFKWDGNIITNY